MPFLDGKVQKLSHSPVRCAKRSSMTLLLSTELRIRCEPPQSASLYLLQFSAFMMYDTSAAAASTCSEALLIAMYSMAFAQP